MTTQEKTHLTVNETASELGVHYMTVYRWLYDGTLRGVKLGPKLWRIPRSEIERIRPAVVPQE